MKYLLPVVVLAISITISCNDSNKVSNQNKSSNEIDTLTVISEEEALNEAKLWLHLIDNKKYMESWEEAGGIIQMSKGIEQWGKQIENIHKHLGVVTSRNIKSKKLIHKLPNFPLGNYYIITYDALSLKRDFYEIVTISKNGAYDKWKVVGYYVYSKEIQNDKNKNKNK